MKIAKYTPDWKKPTINDLRFQYSKDGGKTFNDHEDGKYYPTG